MKLNGLKNTPKLCSGDLDDIANYITAIRRGDKVVAPDGYFHEDVTKYINGELARKAIPPALIGSIVGSSIWFDPESTEAEVCIHTSKSALGDVRAFLQMALGTTSQLAELAGKRSRRKNHYEYLLILDMHAGDYSRRGAKLISNGAFRLAILANVLAQVKEHIDEKT